MRETIPNTGGSRRRPFVVTPDEGANSIILEADGHAVRIGADEARRLAGAMIRAATVAGRPPSAAADLDEESIGDGREGPGSSYSPPFPRAPGSVI